MNFTRWSTKKYATTLQIASQNFKLKEPKLPKPNQNKSSKLTQTKPFGWVGFRSL